MTDQRELDRLLGAFFAEGTNELADRVIDAALDQIDHTQQRRALRVPWRFPTMNTLTRLAVAAVIAVIAVGGALYLTRPSPPAVGGPSATPSANSSPSQSANPTASSSSSVASARAASWTATGNMTTARSRFSPMLLRDGKVLVAGGQAIGGDGFVDRLASAELYDPASGTWAATGSMLTPRSDYTATLLLDGTVLVAGGSDSHGTSLASAELYDPASGTWAATGSMVTKRNGGTATLLPGGRVLAAGGQAIGADGFANRLASAELYDPGTGTWAATGHMGTSRSDHTATLLLDGKVLVAGGDNTSGGGMFGVLALASAELYDPASGIWTVTGDMITPRMLHTATLLPDGRVLAAGGDPSGGYSGFVASAELYDPANGTWTATGSMGSPRSGFTATLLLNGMVLVAGDSYRDNVPLASPELYDPANGTWTATGSMGSPRSGFTATLLLNGMVLVAGGHGPPAGALGTNGGQVPNTLASAELYDPGSGG